MVRRLLNRFFSPLFVIPGPGRLRIPRTAPRPSSGAFGDKVLLFLPARNEEANIAAVIGRLPAVVCGLPARCLVVDDGSADRTAQVAEVAGARVVHQSGLGLGAAVRRGLAEGAHTGAAAVVFCDADGEYDPAEIERLVGPILSGSADFVIGSRFAGGTRRMQLHRNLGNRLLSLMLSAACRRWISDGQSGYRALSPQAAASAEIVHDYNYAQVLTLDLLAKGFRYREVPISYRHREKGKSFVKLVPYLRAVLPAIYRELNSAPPGHRPAPPLQRAGSAPTSR